MRKMIFSLVFSLFALNGVETIPDLAKTPIYTYDFQDRQVEKIKLDNGLEALLISDPDTPNSAAALAVRVGSWHEPKPGLAHFLEHMLFLGTEKYPNESEFDKVIAQYKGQFNAFTSTDMTGYYFAVTNQGFEETLDRFAQFFQTPLFNPSGVNRELNAIDQEFKKNLELDSYKEQEILSKLALPNHPFHQFTTGNLKSLAGTSQEVLKEWHAKAYSSDRMRLFVLSPKPLSEIKALVEKEFSGIKKSDFKLPEFKGPILSNIRGKLITFEPIQNRYILSLMWEVSLKDDEAKPEELVTHILGNEGPNSLSQILKKEGLATSVMAGSLSYTNDEGLFQIEIELTAAGLKNKDKVIGLVLGVIEKLREQGIPEKVYEEVKLLKLLSYQNQTKQDAADEAMEKASTLSDEDLATYPEKSKLIKKFDPASNTQFLNSLDPALTIATLAAPQKDTQAVYTEKEEWTDTPFRIDPLALSIIPSAFQLPSTNPYLPTDFNLVYPQAYYSKFEKLPQPDLIVDEPQGQLYFWGDSVYATPEIYMTFEIRSSGYQYKKGKNQALADLYLKILQYNLLELLHNASLAGTGIDFKNSLKGLQLTVNGYSSPSLAVVKAIRQELKQLTLSGELFQTQLEELKRDYQNQLSNPPYKQSSQLIQETLTGKASIKQKAQALKKVTLEDFKTYIKAFYEKAFVAGLIIGNVKKEEAIRLNQEILSLINRGYPLSQQKAVSFRDLKNGPLVISRKSKGESQGMILAIDIPFSLENRAVQQILGQGLKEAYFRTLRTEQQTGYIVQSANEDMYKHLFHFFLIQSASYSPRELLWRTEAFLDQYLRNLEEEISEEKFEQIKASLITALKLKPFNMQAMGELLFKLAYDYQGNFGWIDERIQTLEKLSYSTFLEKAKEEIGRENKRRIAVELIGQTPPGLIYKPSRN